MAQALLWPEQEQGVLVVPQWNPPHFPTTKALAQHLDRDQQRVQSGGLLWGGHRLAAGLQLADGNPADTLEGLVGLHLPQGDNEDVALFVFDGLEEDLSQVLDAQQPLHNRRRGQKRAAGQGTSSRHSSLWVWAAVSWMGISPLPGGNQPAQYSTH